jgi:serine/threonine protein kinase
VPTELNGSIPSAQQFNPAVSPQFDAILLKGLRPIANQRYQRPAELRQDLLTIRSVSGSIVSDNDNGTVSSNPMHASSSSSVTARVSPLSYTSTTNSTRTVDSTSQASKNTQRSEQTAQRLPDSVAKVLPIILAPTEDVLEERATLLPRPEELEPMKESNDTINATYWLSGILLCLILIVIFSHILG